MALITTMAQVWATGLKISSLDVDASLPDMDHAQKVYIEPYFSEAFLAELAANDVADEEDQDNDLLAVAVLIRKPLAAFAYWADMPAVHSRITDAGIRRTTTDNMPAAFKWEYQEAMAYLEERAYTTLEHALQYLHTNQDNPMFATWLDSSAFDERGAMLFKSGADFKDFYSLKHPYRTFHYLRSSMMDVERMYIAPTIGSVFFATFKTADTSAFNDEELEAYRLMKAAIANLAIYTAARKLPAQITPEGFTVSGRINEAATAPSSDDNLLRAMQAAYDDGKKSLNRLRNYLNTNASETVFTDYFESGFYTDPSTALVDRKNSSRKIFRF